MNKNEILGALIGLAPSIYRDFLAGCDVTESCMLLYGALFAFGEDWAENYLDSTIQEISEAAIKLLL